MSPTLAFGDDRSAEADICWDWIVSHRWEGWGLEVVTAEPPGDMHPVPPGEAKLHPWDPHSPREAADIGFVSVEHLRAEIDPRVALIAKPWDLVAIGPRGSGLLKRLHLGSTADWLLREPTSPLVIAHRPGRVDQVLFAADGSPHARRALECLVSLPWMVRATVHVLSVDDGHVDPDEATGEVERRLAQAGIGSRRVIRRGKPARVILEECDAKNPDLVVMGARGIAGLKRLMIGSTTAAVAGGTDHSLLVAHAPGGGGID